jgi:hypothetical protein
VLGALRLAASDASLGRLDDKRLENIHQTVSEIVEDLGSYKASSDENPSDPKPRKDGTTKGKVVDIESQKLGPTVFCISGLGRLDDCVAVVLADFLRRRGVVARTAAAATAIENDVAETICVCFLEDVTAARGDFTIRKLSRQAPAAKVIVCLLGDASNGASAGGDTAPRSLAAVMTAIEKRLSVSTAGNNKRHPRVQASEPHPRDFDHTER